MTIQNRPRGYKTVFMLNSVNNKAELYEAYPVYSKTSSLVENLFCIILSVNRKG